MTKQEAKQQIQRLVDKYQRILSEGKIKDYNEAQTRNEFIEPMFEFLGWDMRNLSNDNEVTTEENVSGGRVDLAFRFNNIPAMFLEAKALKVDLDEWKWAEQAINYSWNKSVTWALLTDFESIKVFNAEIPPQGVSDNQFFEIKYSEYLEKFDQLWLLSKESFEEKLLDKEAQKWGRLKVRKQVSEKLFEDLMTWRVLITKDLKKLNNLSSEDLDEGVQRILDRLIFIRTTEDRKLSENVLMELARSNKNNLYKLLVKIFREFDNRFDSKLFAEHYCEKWQLSDNILKEVLLGLYETSDGYRYEFSVISADVLGGIYEQYLGYVQGKNVKEKKKSKRKAQGIYYTPKYIVEYIIKETLGEVLKKTKKQDVYKIKVLDPACGSGSFLIAAHDNLLSIINKDKAQASLFASNDILTKNIFGVDLDSQAVEIAQLNLLLKALRRDTKLPDLKNNLRVGNSLISGNEEKLSEYFGDKWRDQKPFGFQEEFKEVFEQGGFDVIIGNPPYVRNRDLPANLKRFFVDCFETSMGQYDIYQLFFEKSIGLLKNGGYLGFITSNKYAIASYGAKLREFILRNCEIVKVIDVSSMGVFKEAATYPYIIILRKSIKNKKNHKIKVGRITKEEELLNIKYQEINQSVFDNNQDKIFTLKVLPKFFEKMEKVSVKLGDIATIKETIHTGNVRNKLIVGKRIDNKCKKLLVGKDCQRYNFSWKGKWIRYDKSLVDRNRGEYGNLCEPKYFESDKILLRDISLMPCAVLDTEKHYTINTLYSIQLKNKKFSLYYLLTLINSRLIAFYFKKKFEGAHVAGGFLRFKKMYTSQIPIVDVNFDDEMEKKKHDRLVVLGQSMMEFYKKSSQHSPNTDSYDILKKDIEKLDKEIDQVVYSLYGLNDDEIKIVENNYK